MGTVASAIPVSLFCCSLWSFHNPALPLKHHPCQPPHFLLRSLHLGTCFWWDAHQSHGISQGFITSWQERLGNRHKGLRSLASWITLVIQVIQNFCWFSCCISADRHSWLAGRPATYTGYYCYNKKKRHLKSAVRAWDRHGDNGFWMPEKRQSGYKLKEITFRE